MQTPESIRRQTEDLNVGYDAESEKWQVIVKYHGNLKKAKEIGLVAEDLIAGYGILTGTVEMIEKAVNLQEIEYMEKPKRFYYTQQGILPREDACVYPITLREPYLSGRGVLAAVLDSGIEYTKMAFRRPNGDTRILFLWDQSYKPNESMKSPAIFPSGVEFDQNQINQAIRREKEGGMWISGELSTNPGFDTSGHGTAVAGILAASEVTKEMTGILGQNGAKKGDFYVGMAPESDFLIVKLGNSGENDFPRTTEIMKSVTYVINKSLELNRPIVINLSLGNTYGPHNGSALLERFLDNAAEIGRTVICVGSGNEADSGGHVFGNLRERSVVEWTVGEYERNLSLQLWKSYSDEYEIQLRSPGGALEKISNRIENGKYELILEQTRILVYVGEPTPYSAEQEIYFEFLPVEEGDYINSGIWQLQFDPVRVVTGEYSMYLPSREVRSSRTAFLRPTPEATFTVPSTASKVVTVGAYDSTFQSYADFSGRGYDRFAKGYGKPDLVAPGVNILAPSIYGGLGAFTGTSFATPIVAGAAALMMEWGIVQGNDPYLYGEKLKAYLLKGAEPLPGFSVYPNAKVGWGKLCLKDSFPGEI